MPRKNLEEQFAEVERRVRALLAENARLADRARELERELAQLRHETRDLQNFHGKRMHVREKIERVLNALEAAERE